MKFRKNGRKRVNRQIPKSNKITDASKAQNKRLTTKNNTL